MRDAPWINDYDSYGDGSSYRRYGRKEFDIFDDYPLYDPDDDIPEASDLEGSDE